MERCSVTLVAAEDGCCPIPITQRPSDQDCISEEHELEAASSILSLPQSSMTSSPIGLEHKIIDKKIQDEEEEK